MDPQPGDRAAALEELSRLVKSAAQEIDRAIVEYLDGVSVQQWHVLAALEGGTGKPMAALGSVTLLPGPSLTRLIDGMVDDNLVLRNADVTDRRRVLVYQTRRGASVYHRIRSRLVNSDHVAALVTDNALIAEPLRKLLAQLRRRDLASPVGGA